MNGHRGVVQAAGLVIVHPTPARVQNHWTTGCQLWSLTPEAVYLQFPVSRSWQAELGPELCAVEREGGWTTLREGRPESGCLQWHWNGSQLQSALSLPFDFKDWFRNLPAVEIAQPLRACAALPPPEPTATAALRLREEIVGEAPPEGYRELLQSLRTTPPPAKVRAERSAGWMAALWRQLGQAAARFYRDHNQKYLDRMVRLFEEGRWQEALLHGIPLAALGTPTGQSFLGRLQPRRELNFRAPNARAGQLPLAGTDYLRKLYRSALQAMLQAGRIEEAVFVQVELLGEVAPALAMLEERHMYAMAARLAEAKQLPGDTQIRLQFLAGNREKALLLARRTGLYFQAHQALLRSHPELAREWRREWAHYLRGQGRTVDAASLLWAERDEWPEVRRWLRDALQTDDAQLTEALALGLRDPGPDAVLVREKLRALLDNQDPESDRQLERLLVEFCRLRVASGLIGESLGPILREAIARGSEERLDISLHNLKLLRDLCEDRWLRMDLPRELPPRKRPDDCWIERWTEKGVAPITDAMLLPDGRSLLALGEAGLVVLSRQGRRQRALAVPCHHLVVPTEGHRVILVYRRGERECSLSFLDGRDLRVEPWCQARLDWFAPEWTHGLWLVGMESSLYQIDASAAGWRSLWKLPGQGRLVEAAFGNGLGLVWRTPEGEQLAEFYDYPSLFLRDRRTLGQTAMLGVTPQRVLERIPSPPSGVELPGKVRLAFLDASRLRFIFGRPVSALCGGDEIKLLAAHNYTARACFVWPGAGQIGVRVSGERAILWDGNGRYGVADLKRSKWQVKTTL